MGTDIFGQLKKIADKDLHDPQWLSKGEEALRAHMRASTAPIPRLYYRKIRWMQVFASVFAMLVAGTGVSLAAQRSVPGDALYGWKIHVNERIESAFTVGKERQATLEVKRLDRRLTEFEQVNSKTQSDAPARVQAQVNVQEQAKKVEEVGAQLKEDGNIEASAQVSTDANEVLEAHKEILENIATPTVLPITTPKLPLL